MEEKTENHLVQSCFFQEHKDQYWQNFITASIKAFFLKSQNTQNLNKNIVKISYSCMKNNGSIISAHNQKILNPIVQSYGSNCRVKSSCPLNGECLTPKIIYRADVSNDKNSKKKFYFSLADTPGTHKGL